MRSNKALASIGDVYKHKHYEGNMILVLDLDRGNAYEVKVIGLSNSPQVPYYLSNYYVCSYFMFMGKANNLLKVYYGVVDL